MLEAGIKKYWIQLQNVSLCTLFCIEFQETNLLKWIKVGLRCSLNLLWHRKCHCKVQKICWSMPFYKFGCSYVMVYNVQNAWCLFCLFCDYWFEIIYYITCNIYTHVLQISCMWIKDGFHFSGQFSGLPTELSTNPNLKVGGCPLSCTLSCPLYPYMEVVGSIICMAKFPWAAHSAAHWAAHRFHIWK